MQFPAVRALHRVSLALRAGEVHGLVGENGAGKSTLMRILSGLQIPTSGDLLIDGQPVEIRSPADALKHGIAMIHQELNLVDELSVADNIFLGREWTRMGFVDRRRTVEAAREVLQSFGCTIDPKARTGSLSIAQQQLVEIAKALSQNARLLIMDEPTAVLTAAESRKLFDLIADLRQRGITVVYISHILPEVLSICDRITVLRDGEVVTTLEPERVKQTTELQLAGLMVGRQLADHYPPRPSGSDEVVLRVEHLSVPGLVENVSFEVRRGEILGFAGLVGAGRTEMAEAIVGLRRRSGGVIRLFGREVAIRDVRDAVKLGMAYLSEDRKAAGLTLGMSIVHNTTLVSLKKYSRGVIDRRAEVRSASHHAQQLRTRYGRLSDPVATLSGGNQQKVALAKWLEIAPQVLIIDEPTRGVDIGAKEEIYRLIRQLTDEGMACIMISSEMNELLGMATRIAVMRDGHLVAILDGATATEEQIMQHAAGVTQEQVR